MNILAVLLLVLYAQNSLSIHLSPPAGPYNVLLLSPISVPSHNKILMHMAVALAERGHQITLLTNYEISEAVENITTLTHGLHSAKSEHFDLFNEGRTLIDVISLIPGILSNMTRDLYKTPVVVDLYRRKDAFDVVIIDLFYNEMMYPFAAGKPFISLVPSGHDPIHSSSYGNMPNPAYVSHSFHNFQTPLSILDRLENSFFTFITPILRYLTVFIPVQYHISRQFPDLPSLAEIERNQSVAFMNSHFSMASPPEALLPGQVEIGAIHCRAGLPLPQDLEDFLSSDQPAVVMSLGSSLSTKYLPEKHKTMLISAFSKLPYKFIWKFDSDQNVSSNVMVKNWLPQQDVLAHPNVKLFITHGGNLGMQEGVYHATPMLAMPITNDQPKNAMRLQNLGIGLMLSWDDVTEDKLINAVTAIITEPRYQEKVSKMSELFRDQPETPSERVVYWTEYVVKHRGAPHLRSAERDLSWIVLHGIDILAILNVGVVLLLLAVRALFKLCFRVKKLNVEENKNKKD